MRNGQRPPQNIIDTLKDQLEEDCEFYGLEWMAHKIRGEISPYDMRYEDRLIRKNELAHNVTLFDVFQVDTNPRPRTELQLPLLMEDKPQPTVKGSYTEFYERLDKFTGGLLADLKSQVLLSLEGQ